MYYVEIFIAHSLASSCERIGKNVNSREKHSAKCEYCDGRVCTVRLRESEQSERGPSRPPSG